MSSRAGHAKQVFLNTLAGLCGSAGTAIIGLALTPFLIYSLGFEAYGFWIVLSTVVNYVGLADFGLESTFIKYTAEYAATKQHERVRQVTTFGVVFYVTLSLLMAPLALVLAPYLVFWMKVSPHLAVQGPLLFAWIIVAYFLQSAAGVLGSVLAGTGSLRLVSLTTFISRLGYAAAAIVLCLRGFGVFGLLIATFVQIAIAAILCYCLARKRVGVVFISPLRIERGVMKKLFKLGGWIQLTNLASTVTMETNRLIISIFVQTSAVTLFEVANRLTRTVRSFPFSFLIALLPAVSAIDATQNDEKVFNRVYVRATRYLNLSTVLLLGFVIGAAEPITRAWLGHAYPALFGMIVVLGLGYIVSNISQVGTTMLRATGLPKYEAFLTILSAAAGIATMFLFVPRFGTLGVAMSMLFGSISGTVYFLWMFHRLRKLSVMAGFFSWYGRLVICGGAATLSILWALPSIHTDLFASRAGAILAVIIDGILYLAVFTGALLITRFFSENDSAGLKRLLPPRVQSLLSRRVKDDAPAPA
ncbi:MAG: oligosaccharide flippase family protein [Candidatus Eremiobacteraeota bacterium]|nr:oligosaccharide flippase family protein [Candidatus Eremiobacteraeota bacterium]